MKYIELLAPAKDLECGIAAINCGADAVYIGASRFGARENASNPLEDIEQLVRHAHTYWAKVYATVNTLLRDDEISPALELIRKLYHLGVDGLIIQDVGLLECELPPIPLIASTQMHNHTPERVAFLEKVGFQRAILARELSLEQITEIRRQTRIELECFIHGALCVCYSGQCYLSYTLGGRSGNRGQCAQPCRKPYSLLDGDGKVLEQNRHLLSLRDLNQTEHLRDLIQAGVGSFKIEGRLKDRAYVMNVVSHYRTELDKVLAGENLRKTSSGKSVIDFTQDVTKTFNRGFTSYFLTGRGVPITSPDTPKMTGEVIGPVQALKPRDMVLDTEVELHNGDGLCFFDREGELHGTIVNGVQGRVVMPASLEGIERGTVIYRNHDHEFLTRLAKSQPERQIGVTFTLRDAPQGLTLQACDEDGVTVELTMACEKEVAQKPEQALENIRKQLQKTGGTAYRCAEVYIELTQTWFVPVSVLNALRRDTLEALTAAREAKRPRLDRPLPPRGKRGEDARYPETRLDYRGNALNHYAETFYRRHGVTYLEPAAESGKGSLRGRPLMTTKLCLKYQLGCCPKQGPTRCVEPLTLVDEQGHKLELRFECGRCEMEIVQR